MSLLPKLSRYIVAAVLSEWLTVVDFVFLDSAMLSHYDNTYWIRFVEEFAVQIQKIFYSEWIMASDRSINWFEARKIRQVPIDLSSNYLESIQPWRVCGLLCYNPIH